MEIRSVRVNAGFLLWQSLPKVLVYTLLSASVGILSACHSTSENTPGAKVYAEPYVSKSAYAEREFRISRGIEKADVHLTANGIVPGFSKDLGRLKAVVTKDELQFYRTFLPDGEKDTPEMVLAFKITDHFDLANATSTDATHEVRDKIWRDRKYMRVDWTTPVNRLARFDNEFEQPSTESGADASSGALSNSNSFKNRKSGLEVEPPQLLELNQKSDGSLDVLTDIKVAFTRELRLTGERQSQLGSVRVRTVLMPVLESDYEANSYSSEDQHRFGFFVTEQDFANASGQLHDGDIKTYANTYNVCGPAQSGMKKKSCSQGVITWVLSEKFPEKFKDLARAAVSDWNNAFKSALGRSDDVVVLDESREAHLVDPRDNVLGFYSERTAAGILGVTQSIVEPSTGEIISSHTTVFGEGLRQIQARITESMAAKREATQGPVQEPTQGPTHEPTHGPMQVLSAIKPMSEAFKPTAGESSATEQPKKLSQDARGVHSIELVDEAAQRFLEHVRNKAANTDASEADGPVAQAVLDEVERVAFYSTLLHEMGHAFGLRHNFAASADQKNYGVVYKQLKARLEAGEKNITPQDLEPFATSSVMDYGAEFFSRLGGVGPYDVAAIHYGYMRDQGTELRNKDAVLKSRFLYCTDNQLDESILCRARDAGANYSVITKNLISSLESRMESERHRRDRTNFEREIPQILQGWKQSLLRIRQPLDELTYSLAQARKAGGICETGFVRQSIALGEIADICDPVRAESFGVDVDDLATYVRGLFDPHSGAFLRKPDLYIAGGLADMIWSSQLAMDYLAATLDAPETGLHGRQLESLFKASYSGAQLETLGYAWNKKLVLETIGESGLALAKYARAQTAGALFELPISGEWAVSHTKKFVTAGLTKLKTQTVVGEAPGVTTELLHLAEKVSLQGGQNKSLATQWLAFLTQENGPSAAQTVAVIGTSVEPAAPEDFAALNSELQVLRQELSGQSVLNGQLIAQLGSSIDPLEVSGSMLSRIQLLHGKATEQGFRYTFAQVAQQLLNQLTDAEQMLSRALSKAGQADLVSDSLTHYRAWAEKLRALIKGDLNRQLQSSGSEKIKNRLQPLKAEVDYILSLQSEPKKN